MDAYNLVSFVGIFALMGIAWGLSKHPRRLNWRCVGFGVGIQLFLALIVFWAPGSTRFFLWLNDLVAELLTAATAGQKFLFGTLADAQALDTAFGKDRGFVLAIQALPVIIFFAALMGLLYYWRIMPAIIRGFAWVFTRLMRVSGAESLCAASNIFVGIESATTIRPYIAGMTGSELCTILTAGMATIASSVLFMYAGFLRDVFPTIAGHLISASILSAPAAIVMSKILLPETGEPLTMGESPRIQFERESGAMEAIVGGAMAGVRMVVGICALLVAFLGLIALVDLLLGRAGGAAEVAVKQLGSSLGKSWDVQLQLSLQRLMGYVMWPFAVLIGVPPADAQHAGELLGKRLMVTELVAYRDLAKLVAAKELLHPRTKVVVAYALCGFAHVASLAIFVGGIAALVPERRRELAAVGPRALLAATLACLMTGAVAGVFFHGVEGVL
jgi:CNT family concentrative nucleoside transporter